MYCMWFFNIKQSLKVFSHFHTRIGRGQSAGKDVIDKNLGVGFGGLVGRLTIGICIFSEEELWNRGETLISGDTWELGDSCDVFLNSTLVISMEILY